MERKSLGFHLHDRKKEIGYILIFKENNLLYISIMSHYFKQNRIHNCTLLRRIINRKIFLQKFH